MPPVVAGIDVGGRRKGFHAVAMAGRAVLSVERLSTAVDALHWCQSINAEVLAVDAPCGWSQNGKSRACERELHGLGVHCYFTPRRDMAVGRKFYDWVFHGEELYEHLLRDFRLFDGPVLGKRVETVIETFPHAIAWSLAGQKPSGVSKNRFRSDLLRSLDIETDRLTNVDFRDAALCAVTAHAFEINHIRSFGGSDEGLIVVPRGRQLFD